MQLHKLIFILGCVFSPAGVLSVILKTENISTSEKPKFEIIESFFNDNKLLEVYLSNLPTDKKNIHIKPKEDLLQELTEGIISIYILAQKKNNEDIEAASLTLNKLFSTKWQEFYLTVKTK